jgi:S1-C subfamily serine protease
VIADEPVGNPVSVISHPGQRFYGMTAGIVSRYFALAMHGTSVTRMAITADFAHGSSGAPVFNEFGNVVGMVTCTDSIYRSREGEPGRKL